MQGIHRELFPILDSKIYLNTCSITPLSIPVRNGIEKFISQWDSFGGVSWVMEDGWNELIEKSRALFAKLINAKPEEIAYSFGNSVALSSVTSAIKLNEKSEIVYNELDFPATATHAMAKSDLGVNYRVVRSKDGKTISTQDYKEKINNNTKLITACHVVSNTGFKLDIKELAELTHEKELDLFIDAYQSMGTTPIDVKKIDVEFLASGCLKWLLGGFGISFLYIRKDRIEELNPTSIGWMGVENPFEDLYDKLRTTLQRPNDATKFQYGTPYPLGAAGAYEGMKLIDEIGISKISDQNQKLTQKIIEEAFDNEFTTITPIEPGKRGSIVNIQLPNAEKITKNLQNDKFILDYRARGIRVSPHFFNNFDDIDALFSAINNKN